MGVRKTASESGFGEVKVNRFRCGSPKVGENQGFCLKPNSIEARVHFIGSSTSRSKPIPLIPEDRILMLDHGGSSHRLNRYKDSSPQKKPLLQLATAKEGADTS